MNVSQYLKETYGYNPQLRQTWEKKITEWRSWYKGYNNSDNTYMIFNGQTHVPQQRKSLQMAKKVCEDWADVLYNINCQIKLDDAQSRENLGKILNKNSWWLTVNHACELAFAVGTVALVVNVVNLEVDENGKINNEDASVRIDTVEVEKVYPLSWVNGRCTECAFVSYQKSGKKTFAVISVHLRKNGVYIIENRVFEIDASNNIINVDTENELDIRTFSTFNTESEIPWFSLISPAIAENIFTADEMPMQYPLGISIFANAIDALKGVDFCYDSLINEINLGRKRLFISESLCKDVNGNPVFDINDVAFQMLPDGMKSEDLIQPETSPLRTAEIISALNSSLSAVSNAVGMGKEMYKFDITAVSTATQINSTNSELKRKMDKHRTKLENELFDFLTALINAANRFTGENINPDGLTLEFDLAQFESEEIKSQRKLREKDSGVISSVEYRMSVFGEDEETATENIEKVRQEQAEMLKMTMIQEE